MIRTLFMAGLALTATAFAYFVFNPTSPLGRAVLFLLLLCADDIPGAMQ